MSEKKKEFLQEGTATDVSNGWIKAKWTLPIWASLNSQ